MSSSSGRGMPQQGQWSTTAQPTQYGEGADDDIPLDADPTALTQLQYTPGQMSGWDNVRNVLSLGRVGREQAAYNTDAQKQALLYNTGMDNERAQALFNNTTALRAKQDTERAGLVTTEKTEEDIKNEQAGRALRSAPASTILQLNKMGVNVTGTDPAQDGFLLRHYLGKPQVDTAGLLSGVASGARDVYGAGKTTAMIAGAPAEGEAQQDSLVTGYQADTSRNLLSRIGTDAQMPLAGRLAAGAQGSILDTQRLGKLTTAQAEDYAKLHPNQAQEDAHNQSVANVNRTRMFDVPVGGAAIQLDQAGNPANFMQMGGMDINNPLAKPGIKFGTVGGNRPAPIKLDAGQVRQFLSSPTNAPQTTMPQATNGLGAMIAPPVLPNSTAQSTGDPDTDAVIARIKQLRGMRTYQY